MTATFSIALWARDEIIDRRLRARPKERGFTTDEAIRPHIEYNQWIGKNRGKYQLFIDTEDRTTDDTTEAIGTFINRMSDESSEV